MIKPAHNKNRPRLNLEKLEDRILLDVTLGAGEWTYFDINGDNAPDSGDVFVGVDDGATTGITVIANANGNEAPTGIEFQGDPLTGDITRKYSLMGT
jgi:hypothetical protein